MSVDDDGELPGGEADDHELGVRAASEDFAELGVDLSPWPPLLGLPDATEPEGWPDDGPFTPSAGVEKAHALELRAESMLHYAARGAERTGALDRTEVGDSDDNRDVVAGRDAVEVDGLLEEHTGRGLVVVADEVEMNVGGPLTMQAHLEDNVIMAGVMRDELAGGTVVAAAMSDDLAAGPGLRCTAPLDVWVHGLVGMEERPGTCAADGLLFELAGTLYEREYGPSAHVAAVARHSGTVVTTMKTGFRPLMKTALGVRNLIPGGGGGGGAASAAPPGAPPGGGAGAATLTAVDSGAALGRGAAGGGDTDEVLSVVRTLETASDATDVEDLQHPASTADNLDELARADVEGAGPQQVAEICEQPIPLAPDRTAAEPTPGARPGAAGPRGNQPPPLDHTPPGTEGYDFRNAYGSLHDRNQLYRQEMNLRGNLYLREYLGKIDEKAIALFTGLGRSADEAAIDSYGLRASSAYAGLQAMAEEAEAAGDLDRLARIRAAMGELEALVHTTIGNVSARTDDFAGAAIGSQRGPVDPNIDVTRLRRWLEDRKLAAQRAMMDPETPFESVQRLSWTQDYYDQTVKALDAGINPLAESGDQVVFLQAGKIEPFNERHASQSAADIAALGLDPGEWAVIPPRAQDQDQLDLFLELHDGLMETLSDPELFRSADEMDGGGFLAPGHGPLDPGPDLPGPAVSEPDVPGPGSVRPPEAAGADPSPDAGPAVAGGTGSKQPPPLDRTPPGTEGYDFRTSYRSLCVRNQHYRESFNFRGNFFLREYLQKVDEQVLALFTKAGGPAAAIETDNFGHTTASMYDALRAMAEEAETTGDVDRAARARVAMGDIEAVLDRTLGEVAGRTGEFAGTAIGAQSAPIDRNVDTAKLRDWLEDRLQQAHARQQQALMTGEGGGVAQHATWELGYYTLLIQSLDEGVNPLATSGEQATIMRMHSANSPYTSFTDDAAQADELLALRPRESEAELYARLQALLVETLSDPWFHRSAEEMGLDAFTPAVRRRIEAGLDFLGPDSLRPLASGDPPPPLPAADVADSAVHVDEFRDRSFSRSALAASEETLERHVAGLAEGEAGVRAGAPGPGAPEPSLGGPRALADDAQAPLIDERSGVWVVEPTAAPGASPTPVDTAPAPRGDEVSVPGSEVSWESGVRVSDDSELGSDAGDADIWDRFEAAFDSEDMDPEDVGDARHGPVANDDGASGPPTPGSDATMGEDANPTGTVSEPGDFTNVPGSGDTIGPAPPGAPSPVTPGTPHPPSATGSAPGTGATPPGASPSDAPAGAVGARSHLYGEPVSLEGLSLEGAPRSDHPRELARSLDGADVPVENLPRVEPVGTSIPGRSDVTPPGDSYHDVHAQLVPLPRQRAERDIGRLHRGTGAAEIARAGGRDRAMAPRASNLRWSEQAAAQRTLPIPFGDDPRRLADLVEEDASVFWGSGERYADLYRGADPPNTSDRAHAARYIPGTGGPRPTDETGFGRLAQGWSQFPFSRRERILNALARGEALSPDQIAALASGLEGYRAAEGGLASSQYRAMADMVSDLGDPHRRVRWHMHGWRRQRVLQLVEMLDYAAAVI